MATQEFIKRALDTTNAFFSTGSEATAVNPNVWDMRLREFQEKMLVVTPLAEQVDFTQPGTDLKITIDEEPSAAAALVETDDVSISSFSTRNVTHDPAEYGAAYQLTKSEAVRAFFDVAERMVRKLGYSTALKKDRLGAAAIQDGATSNVFPNSVTAATDIASTDTLDYASILEAKRTIEEYQYVPTDLLISYKQKQDLLSLGTINKADEFGTRDAIQRGVIGELFGLRVVASHSIQEETAATADTERAVVLGTTMSGERAFGIGIKRPLEIEREYHARGRFWDIVATEEYDFKVYHPNAICTITTYHSA